MKKKIEWSEEFPTEKGNYWFYGWTSSFENDETEPRMRFVKIIVLDDGSLYVVADGQLMFKCEEPKGKWAKADVPNPPKL